MSEVTVQDNYGDTITVEPHSDHSGIYLTTREGSYTTSFDFDTEGAEALIAGIAAVANLDRSVKPHPDAVLASSVSYNEAVLRLAAAHDRTVEFSYTKGDGRVIERRRLQPESLREVKGHLTFTGFDPDRQDVRAYRLDRISGEVSL